MDLINYNDIDLVIDIENNEDFSLIKNWRNTYNSIERSLSSVCDDEEYKKIMTKVANIVYVLTSVGRGYEDLVLETAQILEFSKETGLDINMFRSTHGDVVVEAVYLLSQKLDNQDKLDEVFLSHEFAFISKIKLAEYIVELMCLENKEKPAWLIEEIDNVIKNYKNRAQQGLMNLLIELREKV